jgi:hypothetical protein
MNDFYQCKVRELPLVYKEHFLKTGGFSIFFLLLSSGHAHRGEVTHKRQIVALFVLTAYMMAGFLLEIAHHDEAMQLLKGQQALASQESAGGARRPLEMQHNCLACSQLLQRFSTPASSFILEVQIPLCLRATPPQGNLSPFTDYLFSAKRGPPLA